MSSTDEYAHVMTREEVARARAAEEARAAAEEERHVQMYPVMAQHVLNGYDQAELTAVVKTEDDLHRAMYPTTAFRSITTTKFSNGTTTQRENHTLYTKAGGR